MVWAQIANSYRGIQWDGQDEEIESQLAALGFAWSFWLHSEICEGIEIQRKA